MLEDVTFESGRIFRRLINFLTTLSLLLLIAATALWVRSLSTQDEYVLSRRHTTKQPTDLWCTNSIGVNSAYGWLAFDYEIARPQNYYVRWSINPEPCAISNDDLRWDFKRDHQTSAVGTRRIISDILKNIHYTLTSLRDPWSFPQETCFSNSRTTTWSASAAGNDDFVSCTREKFVFGIADWFIIALATPLPLLFISRRSLRYRKRRHRLQHGLCLACGYDMRATPMRCPECGHAAGE